MRCLEIFILTTLFNSLFCDVNFDYYWRYYNGDIPVDAIPGGIDNNKNAVYIGQAYYLNSGIIPTTIYPGKKSVMVGFIKPQEVFNYIKILCSSSLGNFKWIRATAKDFHLQMINKHLVLGGKQGDRLNNIGRYWHQKVSVIGKVLITTDRDNTFMYYVYGNSYFQDLNSYEVLVYEPLANISSVTV